MVEKETRPSPPRRDGTSLVLLDEIGRALDLHGVAIAWP